MNHNDQAIEQEIVVKGKTAPRVTPADIVANIALEHYFTADQTIAAVTPQHDSLRLLTFCVLVLQNGFTVTGESACASPENFDAEIGRKVARQNAVQKIWPLMGYELKQQLHRDATPNHDASGLAVIKVAHAHLRRESSAACVISDEAAAPGLCVAIGSPGDIARLVSNVDAPKPEIAKVTNAEPVRLRQAPGTGLPPHQQRVIEEKRDLDERKEKLEAFFDTATFAQLDDSEQGRLHAQHAAMVDYSRVLGDRIEAFTSLAAA